MNDYQRLIDRIDARIRERDKLARRARKNKEYSWETIYTAHVLGLLDARNIISEAIETSNEMGKR